MKKEIDPDPFDPRVQGTLHAADRYLRTFVDGLSYADAVETAQEVINRARVKNADLKLLLPARTDPVVQTEKPLEYALGKSYIGIKGLLKLEQGLQMSGVNVEFHTSQSGDVSKKDLQIAHEDNEFYFHHPDRMVVDGSEVPLTFTNFIKLFRNRSLLHVPELQSLQDVKWFENEYFAREEGQLRPGGVFVAKNSLAGSYNATFERQLDLMESHKKVMEKRGGDLSDVRCRTPFEAFFDRMTLFFYRAQFMNSAERVPAQLNGASEAILVHFEPKIGAQVNVDRERRGSSFIGMVPTRGVYHPASHPPRISPR